MPSRRGNRPSDHDDAVSGSHGEPSSERAGRLDAVRERLRGRVAILSGAGLSAASGVPTFRGSGDHPLWSRFDPIRLASPKGFAQDPTLVRRWYAWRRGLVARAMPNAAHRAIASRPDLVHVTQNVDDLAERAGAESASVLHLHGAIMRERCHRGCGWATDVAESAVRRARAATDEMEIPPEAWAPERCPECDGPARPAVVWFGESLDSGTLDRGVEAMRACDALLVVGTSGLVQPAASLPGIAASSGAFVVVVDPEPTALDELAGALVRAPAADVLPRLLD